MLGPRRVERVAAARAGDPLAGRVQAGDMVSLHWDWICDALTVRQAAALYHYTASQLRVANLALRRPAAALV
jgi:hypothetical protein